MDDEMPTRRRGRIVTVFAPKGGYGKTTLATNLAAALNAGGTNRVCLVDLDLEFGDVAHWLHLEAKRSLLDGVPLLGAITPASICRLVTGYRQGFDCILAPSAPGANRGLPPAVTAEVLALLPLLYDYIVVDNAAGFSGHVLAALDAADHHVALSTTERPALRNLRHALDILELLAYEGKRASVVINQADSRLGLTDEEIDKVLKAPVTSFVPYVWDVPVSINRGVPLVYGKPDHPVSRAISDFATTRLGAQPLAPDAGDVK